MARFKRRFSRQPSGFIPPEQWPIDGGGVQILLDLEGGTHVELHDDCPICRRLRETGEPVFTLDPFGNLVPISSG